MSGLRGWSKLQLWRCLYSTMLLLLAHVWLRYDQQAVHHPLRGRAVCYNHGRQYLWMRMWAELHLWPSNSLVRVKLLDCGRSNWTRRKWHMHMLSQLLLLNPFTIMCYQLHQRPSRDRLWFTHKHRPMFMRGQVYFRYGLAQLRERCNRSRSSRSSRRKGTKASNSSCDWSDYRLSGGNRDCSRNVNHGSSTLYEETQPKLRIKWLSRRNTLKKSWSNFVTTLILNIPDYYILI